MTALSAPFPWFGGKRKVAREVWERFGGVVNYVEPFFGSGAVLFGRPLPFSGIETINDADGLVANCWRAIKTLPDATAEWADNPVNENDLHARHVWLLGELPTLPARLESHPDWCDAKIAGWWLWGVACWIGGGFCSGRGPWIVDDGALVDSRQRPHLGDNGQGVKRQRPHLGNNGQGVKRQRPGQALVEWFGSLSERLARVRVCCGDWSRVCGPSVTYGHGLTGVFLDPPYADTASRAENLYRVDSNSIAHDVREWALENGDRRDMRIALCGYEGEHVMPDSWSVFEWNDCDGRGYGLVYPENKCGFCGGTGHVLRDHK